MNETKFYLYDKSKRFSKEIIEHLVNIPKKYEFIKYMLLKYDNKMIEQIRFYMLNKNSTSNIKNKNLKELLLSISMIDYYLSLLNDLKILGKEKLKYFSLNLLEIKKITYGVIESEKK